MLLINQKLGTTMNQSKISPNKAVFSATLLTSVLVKDWMLAGVVPDFRGHLVRNGGFLA
jgi:hypothetical protein